MINLLILTTLFPNAKQPRHGIFIETRLKELRKSAEVSAVVVAPVPWFPSSSAAFGKYAVYAQVPHCEERDGVMIYHPRYLALPKIGMYITPFFLAIAMLLTTLKLIRKGHTFDLIDSHYFYPDGVAAAIVSLFVKLPLVISARGSDINVLPHYFIPRKLIQWAGQRADAVIAVSDALKKCMLRLGFSEQRVHTLRNGVNTDFFKRSSLARVNQQIFSILSVGNLVELKGHHLVIEALTLLPDDVYLTVVGSGPEEAALKQLTAKLRLTHRVEFISNVLQKDLISIYSASDALVLASSREGWANVILESLACGTPVIATNVGGAKEAITAPVAGMVIDERSPAAIAAAVQTMRDLGFGAEEVSAYAQTYGWSDVVAKQLQLYKGTMTYA